MTDYPAIRKWHKDTGSNGYYIGEMIERARDTQAPPDAIYQRDDGSWMTVGDLTSGHPFRLWYEREVAAA